MPALLLGDGRVQPVEVGEDAHVAADARRAVADLGDRRVEHLRAAAGHEDVCPLGGEPPRRGQADAGGGAGDDRCPALEVSLHAGEADTAAGPGPPGGPESLTGLALPPGPCRPANIAR
jgi:hypothetical protein